MEDRCQNYVHNLTFYSIHVTINQSTYVEVEGKAFEGPSGPFFMGAISDLIPLFYHYRHDNIFC